jgi:hypothetical protein
MRLTVRVTTMGIVKMVIKEQPKENLNLYEEKELEEYYNDGAD